MVESGGSNFTNNKCRYMQRMSQFVIITEALVISFFKDNMMLWFHIFEEYIFGHVPPV